MSEPSNGGTVKPIAIRLDETTRAQLDIIAQLNDRTVTGEIRAALNHWIERTKTDKTVQERAAYIRAEIEREAKTKRDAIAAIFDTPSVSPSKSARTQR